MLRPPAPELVSLTGCDALVEPTVSAAKVRLAGEIDAPGAEAAPDPVSETVCGLVGALSEIVRVPVRVPPAVGENVTLMLQLALAPRLEGQLFVSP